MTYDEYTSKIAELLKIKLTNYRLTGNDIEFLIRLVYDEIATEVNIKFYEFPTIVDRNVNLFDTSSVTEDVPGSLLKVVDDRYVDITKYFKEVSFGVYKIDRFCNVSVDEQILAELDGREITFVREMIPDIETLSDRLQIQLLSVIVAGIMFHAHDSIPSPTSSNVPFNETGMYKSMYDKAIEQLKNKLPQRK